jgi:ATP-dependent Lhr-like helicase
MEGTKILPPSGSDLLPSFDRLHPEVRRWIRDQGWEELRDVQDRAIRAVLDTKSDILITASTAAGKTEAAFLPILTQVAGRLGKGLSVLYVSPLKALINDQFRRLDLLCERMEIEVVRWHGDAPQGAKARTLRSPSGVALITPESIEALFLRRTTDAKSLFGTLDFIVIDELHAFLQGPRGLHLASLLHRIDLIAKGRARRIGLSATIGDPTAAMAWLCPAAPHSVCQIDSSVDAPELRLQVRGYVEPPDPKREGKGEQDAMPPALDRIADHAFSVLRGENNLFFAGSRGTVEALCDHLRRRSEIENVPNEFFTHHGNISKELREELELRLKEGNLPTTAVATTTLELGIDIGSVKSIATIDAPRSLASLRQRLGRSGRRKGVPAILRIYVREDYVAADTDPLKRLRLNTVRAVASIRLLLQRFVEPPGLDPSLLSVVLHQTLSVIVEHGGAKASILYRTICSGPLSSITPADYAELLRAMSDHEIRLIEQAPDGTIMLGEDGEVLVTHRDFYSVFQTNEEWRIISGARTLGTIPLSNSVGIGSMIVFAGQRWRIVALDDRAKVLEVVAHRAAQVPRFDRPSSEKIHDRLAREMYEVYLSDEVPSYLDETAAALLFAGRNEFGKLALGATAFAATNTDTHLFLWRGTAFNDAFAILFAAAGLECQTHDVGVTVTSATAAEVKSIIQRVSKFPSSTDLSDFVKNLRTAKYDDYVPETLLRRMWARDNTQICDELPAVCRSLVMS